MQRFDTPVRITIHSFRKRLADPDGVSGKAAIDGCVKAGLLVDDSAKEVWEVRYRQSQSETERTVIEIEEVDGEIDDG